MGEPPAGRGWFLVVLESLLLEVHLHTLHMFFPTGASPISLSKSPFFNLSFGSYLHTELISLVNRVSSEPNSSTPVPQYRHGTTNPSLTPLDPHHTSNTFRPRHVQFTSRAKFKVFSPPSFMTTPSKTEAQTELVRWGSQFWSREGSPACTSGRPSVSLYQGSSRGEIWSSLPPPVLGRHLLQSYWHSSVFWRARKRWLSSSHLLVLHTRRQTT